MDEEARNGNLVEQTRRDETRRDGFIHHRQSIEMSVRSYRAWVATGRDGAQASRLGFHAASGNFALHRPE